ncbi:hypothetical protein [Actinoplanes nipponensis]|uniref:hypothetical protein n=1 Tax=Actinoplanes nipponensis TaxID=135950 RepID=UPI0031E70A14
MFYLWCLFLFVCFVVWCFCGCFCLVGVVFWCVFVYVFVFCVFGLELVFCFFCLVLFVGCGWVVFGFGYSGCLSWWLWCFLLCCGLFCCFVSLWFWLRLWSSGFVFCVFCFRVLGFGWVVVLV